MISSLVMLAALLDPGVPKLLCETIRLEEEGRYAEQAAKLEEALAGIHEAGPLKARILNNLGVAHERLGRSAEAESEYVQAIRIYLRFPGQEPDVPRILNNLAGVHAALGKYPQAERAYERALEAGEAVLGRDHTELARSWNGLGEIYLLRRKYPQAEEALRKAVDIASRNGEEELAAGFRNNLANVLRETGRREEGESLLRRAVATLDAVSPRHRALPRPLVNLAVACFERGAHEEAKALIERGLKLSQDTYGPEHPETGLILLNYAEVLRHEGRKREARDTEKRAQRILERGPNNRSVIDVSAFR